MMHLHAQFDGKPAKLE